MASRTKTSYKVLVLHELGTNGESMRKRLRSFSEALQEHQGGCSFEFVYIDAPYMMPANESIRLTGHGKHAVIKLPPATQFDKMPDGELLKQAVEDVSYWRAAQAELLSNKLSPQRPGADVQVLDYRKISQRVSAWSSDLIKRAEEMLDESNAAYRASRMWSLPTESPDWAGQEYSLKYLWSILESHGPFDGAIGFSSGALMIQFVQAMLVNSSIRAMQPLCQGVPQQPFQFVMHFAPYYVISPYYQSYLPASAYPGTRALILYGAKDAVLKPHHMKADALWTHSGGHSIPKDAEWPSRAAQWFVKAARGEENPPRSSCPPNRLANL